MRETGLETEDDAHAAVSASVHSEVQRHLQAHTIGIVTPGLPAGCVGASAH